jgi:hypothetical protein
MTPNLTSAAWSTGGGGLAPAGNGAKPVRRCARCGAMYSGGTHRCLPGRLS